VFGQIQYISIENCLELSRHWEGFTSFAGDWFVYFSYNYNLSICSRTKESATVESAASQQTRGTCSPAGPTGFHLRWCQTRRHSCPREGDWGETGEGESRRLTSATQRHKEWWQQVCFGSQAIEELVSLYNCLMCTCWGADNPKCGSELAVTVPLCSKFRLIGWAWSFSERLNNIITVFD
jgi:hypothetical protein